MSKKTKTADRHKGKMFGVRLPEELSQQVRIMAVRDDRSFSNIIVVLVREAIAARNGVK